MRPCSRRSDVDDRSFFDKDFRPLESLAPDETATARVRVGAFFNKDGVRAYAASSRSPTRKTGPKKAMSGTIPISCAFA